MCCFYEIEAVVIPMGYSLWTDGTKAVVFVKKCIDLNNTPVCVHHVVRTFHGDLRCSSNCCDFTKWYKGWKQTTSARHAQQMLYVARHSDILPDIALDWLTDLVSPEDSTKDLIDGYIPLEDISKITKDSNPKDILGVKKVPMSVIPANVLQQLGVAMLEGATKYGRHNYRHSGARSSVYYDATMRHLMSWYEGEDVDPDSGLSHVIKAIASLTVLADCVIRGNLEDDRPPRSVNPEQQAAVAELIEGIATKYSHIKPVHYTQKGVDDAATN